MTAERQAARPPDLVWNWSDALRGLILVLPAAIVAVDDVQKGLGLAVGVLPAAIIGLQPRRRGRIMIVVVGVLFGCSILLGAVLSAWPWVAVPVLFVGAIGAAEVAERRALGQLLMVLALPLFAIGFSYDGFSDTIGLALVVAVGSVYGWLVALCWPETAPSPRPPPSDRSLLGYGVRLGLAGASAAAIGFAFDLDHVGWAAGAALLVMRPSEEMLKLRAVGRLVAVFLGALVAVAFSELTTDGVLYACALLMVMAGAAATHASRWYVTAGFTTFIVISLLIYARPEAAHGRFNERVLETLLGVGLAYLFGLALPALGRRVRG